MRPLFRRLPLISPCDLIPKPPNFRGVLRAASQFKLCRLKQRGILPLLFCLSSHLRPRLKLSSTARTQRGPRTTRCRFLDSLPRSVRLLASTYLPPGPYSLTGRSSVRGCHARLWQIINRRSVPLNRGRPHRKYRSPIQKRRCWTSSGGTARWQALSHKQSVIAATTGPGKRGARLKLRCSPSYDGVAQRGVVAVKFFGRRSLDGLVHLAYDFKRTVNRAVLKPDNVAEIAGELAVRCNQ
jgi:hypothetical protein